MVDLHSKLFDFQFIIIRKRSSEMLSQECQEFCLHRGGGVWQTPPPFKNQRQTLPGQTQPPGRQPPADTTPGQTSHSGQAPQGGHHWADSPPPGRQPHSQADTPFQADTLLPGRHPPSRQAPPRQTPPSPGRQPPTAVDRTRHTGMHSCFVFFFHFHAVLGNIWPNNRLVPFFWFDIPIGEKLDVHMHIFIFLPCERSLASFYFESNC